jgi:TonB family protein
MKEAGNRSLIPFRRWLTCLIVGLFAVGASLGEAPVDEVQQASDKLFAALGLKEAQCPAEDERLRPSYQVLCGKVKLDGTEFMRQVDALFADPVTLGVVAVASGGWYDDVSKVEQRYYIGKRSITVSRYRYNGKVVIRYPEYFAVCGAPGEPALVSAASQPEGILPPVPQPETKKPPLFPEFARRARTEGHVVLQTLVGTDGVPRDICVVKGTGNGLLGFEYAAIQAMKNWRFEPAQRDGQPVELTTAVGFHFSLR